jgi:hypothetical protein
MLVCVFLHSFAHETAGAARIRLSLRPLVSRDKVFAKLGQTVSRERGVCFVVPANAGTHNPVRLLLEKVSSKLPEREGTA